MDEKKDFGRVPETEEKDKPESCSCQEKPKKLWESGGSPDVMVSRPYTESDKNFNIIQLPRNIMGFTWYIAFAPKISDKEYGYLKENQSQFYPINTQFNTQASLLHLGMVENYKYSSLLMIPGYIFVLVFYNDQYFNGMDLIASTVIANDNASLLHPELCNGLVMSVLRSVDSGNITSLNDFPQPDSLDEGGEEVELMMIRERLRGLRFLSAEGKLEVLQRHGFSKSSLGKVAGNLDYYDRDVGDEEWEKCDMCGRMIKIVDGFCECEKCNNHWKVDKEK